MGEADGVEDGDFADHVLAGKESISLFADAVHEVAGVGGLGGVVAEGEVDGFAQFWNGVVDEAGVDVI